jgi:hypothetical protein
MPPSPNAPRFAQKTLQARSLEPRDLLPEWREEVVEVLHGARTCVRFASGRERTTAAHEQVQVIRDGRRAARAWLLNALLTKELPRSSVPELPWYLAEALEELVRSGVRGQQGAPRAPNAVQQPGTGVLDAPSPAEASSTHG